MSVEETIATYDRIAADYAHRWQDRSIMALALARFLKQVPGGATVLDVGCGPGFDCLALSAHGLRVVGLDLSRGMLQVGRSRGYPGHFVQADMRRLPLNNSLDGIWCNAAMLHLAYRDAVSALREFFRVLRHGGALFIAVKEGQGEAQRSQSYGPDAPRYFTYWQGDQLDAALRQSGFKLASSWTGDAPERRWLCRLASK